METKVKYLVDTNVWLERLLDQEKSIIASKFFDIIQTDSIFVSDFSIHSIGVILSRLKKYDIFEKIINDLFINGRIELLSLVSSELLDVIENIQKFKLDFDDAYQFTVAQKYDLTIVTFDKDFNAKGIKKQAPEEIVGNRLLQATRCYKRHLAGITYIVSGANEFHYPTKQQFHRKSCKASTIFEPAIHQTFLSCETTTPAT